MLVSRNHQSRPFQRQWSRLTTPHGARGHIGIAAELASDPPASNAVMPFVSRVSGELIVEPSALEQFADRLANIPMAIAPVETDDPWRDYEMLDDLIYDVGMHTGEDTEFYLKKGFRVVGIEANAQLCEECAHKFSAAIGSGQLQIINKAISHTAGTIDFFVNEQVSIWGTANLEWVKRNEARGFKSHPVKVEATTIKDVILKFGMPYYMKVDIEGMDSVCLEGLLSVEEKPKYISVEASATSIKDTFTQLHLLDRLGYTRFKIVPQLNITEQRCPDPAREGIFVDHRFEGGSSGLFGEEVPGEWRPLNSVKWDYRRIHLDYRMVGPNNGIFRNFPSRKIRRLLETVFWNGLEWHDTHATF